MRRKTVLPPAYLYAAIVVVVAIDFLFPVKRIIPFPWDLLGLIPLTLWIAVKVIADKAFRGAETGITPFQESSALLMKVVYRISHHPRNLGFLLLLVGLAILLGSLTPFFVVPIFALVMDRVLPVTEERRFEEKGDRAWFHHRSHTNRWV